MFAPDFSIYLELLYFQSPPMCRYGQTNLKSSIVLSRAILIHNFLSDCKQNTAVLCIQQKQLYLFFSEAHRTIQHQFPKVPLASVFAFPRLRSASFRLSNTSSLLFFLKNWADCLQNNVKIVLVTGVFSDLRTKRATL